MITESSYISAYLFADQIIGSLIDAAPEGLILSIDIGGSLLDTVARNAARSSVNQFMESPTLARFRSTRHGAGNQSRAADIIDRPILFGRIDGFLRLADDCEIFESYGPRLDDVATRSIDRWADGRPEIRHIHFGDPSLTLDQMAGAAEKLERHRPTASFYTSGLDRSRLLALLEIGGYRVFDLGADEVRRRKSDAMTDFGWIAVPAEKQVDVSSALSEARKNNSAQYFEWQNVMQRNAPARQQRNRAVFGLPAHAPPMERKFAAGEIIVEDDCYPAESDGINSWRWLGPRARTRLLLPCSIPGIYQVEIVVIANHLRNGLGGCRVLVDGREVRATIHGVDQGIIRFIGQIEARSYTGCMVVDLISPGAVTPAGTDPRTLRLNVQSIAVSPWR